MSSGVTWGSNTVHTIGGAPSPAPASGGFSFGASSASPAKPPATGGSLFGAPSPAPSGGSAFGAPSGGSLFGSTAPAPSTGGSLFGTPAPAPGGSLFGAPAPAPGGSLFGTPAPAPGGSLFGAPAPGAFGSTGGFGQSQQPRVPQHHIPAQAAMEAKISAERVVEAERIRTKIEKLHREYSGTCVVPEDGEESAKFVAIVYNELTPEERQLRLIHGMATGQAQPQSYSLQSQPHQPIFAPQRPQQINGRDWKMAVVNNPDPNNYVPTPIIGAVALQGRVSNQQARAKEYADNAIAVQKNLEFIRQREAMVRQDLMEKDRHYATLRRRLLEVMMRVEVARCLNKPLQPDEHKVMQRLANLLNQVERLRGAYFTLQDQAKTLSASGGSRLSFANDEHENGNNHLLGVQKDELLTILTEQRRKLEKLHDTAKTDIRDVGLIGRRVVATVPSASIPHP